MSNKLYTYVYVLNIFHSPRRNIIFQVHPF